jgi:cullin-associated NEDD8-dissociated protein 1
MLAVYTEHPSTHLPRTPQVASKDKDFRYMATSDLLNELSKDTFMVDPELERKLCGVVAVQLEDASGDISGLAVKW